MAKKLEKTNAMRILAAAGLPHTLHSYDDSSAISGVEVAAQLDEDPDHVFKTLVTQGKSGEHFVFMIPVAQELDLKKAAKACGEKSVAMIKSRDLLPTTGYVHGGCSPVGMKKQFPAVFHETAILYDTICVSAGKVGAQVELAPQALLDLLGASAADITVE